MSAAVHEKLRQRLKATTGKAGGKPSLVLHKEDAEDDRGPVTLPIRIVGRNGRPGPRAA